MENYKEKYEQALERAKSMYEQGMMPERIEYIFPELKESEDEEIRTYILNIIKINKGVNLPPDDADKMIAWLEKQGNKTIVTPQWMIDFLDEHRRHFGTPMDYDERKEVDGKLLCIKEWLEKQGEQKPIDVIKPKFKPGDKIVGKDFNECDSGTIKEIRDGKYIFEDNSFIYIQEQDLWQLVYEYEPKFKVGDWIISSEGTLCYIVSVDKTGYETNKGWLSRDYYERIFHLWTIKDAKDGDVLYHKCPLTDIEYIVMNRGINEYGYIDSYFRYNSEYGFSINVPSVFDAKKDIITPATKEQRDLLFSKMKEAGYEWDSEKKKLVNYR